ncbi:hypothetical protein [Cellulosimicrobium funkei]|uniref:hypothetical protein n=1 Tax=Cellulosimicrobium funkei TaxID=264251 RepID=UPI003424DE92
MAQTRGIDEHTDNLARLRATGVAVDVPRGPCETHGIRLTSAGTCVSCAGDHHAGEHGPGADGTPRPKRTCAHCYPTPVPAITHTTYADRSSR